VILLIRNLVLTLTAGLLSISAFCQVPHNGPAPHSRLSAVQATQSGIDQSRKIYQGDIILDKPGSFTPDGRPSPQFLTVASPQSLWPKVNGVATVYYVNANANATDPTDEAANANIKTAINIFNADFPGAIQWVPWTSADGTYYVEINLSAGNFSGECEAAEGFENEAQQPMTGSAACAVGTILHEMGHIIGLWHEFERPDAANYITVNYNNVIKGSWGNFETLTQNAEILGPYDYASVMQYTPYSFTRNGGPVIETIPAGMPLANVEGVPEPVVDGTPVEGTADYSAGDKEAIDRLYGAPPTQVTVTSNPVGLTVDVDGTSIVTPQIFSWALNSTHTLNVPTGVQSLSGGIENSTTTATFYYTYGRWNDNTAQSHTITVLPGDGGVGFPATAPQVATYSANFIELVPYTTTVSPASTGTVAVSPAPQSYSGTNGQFFVARQQATLTATPVSGWSFYEFNNGPYWLPGGLGANPKTFYVPDTGNPVDMTVEFTNAPVYKVDITPETFSSNLLVVVDGGYYDTPKNFSPYQYYDPSWTSGSSHTLTYNSPDSPYSLNSRFAFSKWSDGGAASHSITSLPATGTSYVATVIPQFAPATNFSYPPCGGTGTLSPPSPTNDGFYPTGQVLTYSETPGTGWTFAGWTFDLTGTAPTANLTATDETLVFANFNLVDAPLTVTGVSPSSANAGGAAFTLTFFGTGFSPNSVVGISNGTTTFYPTVTYVGPGELTVPVTAAQIATAGSLSVYVENFPAGSNGCAVFGFETFIIHGTNLATSTAVSSSSNPSVSGSSVTFTAAVTSAESNATGTVTFMDSSTVLGTGTVTQAGVATYSTAALAAGTHSITAVYNGDSNNAGSTSAVLTQTVTGQAVLTTPAPGSTLGTSNVTFSWTAGAGATSYRLFLGTTGVGSLNLYNSGTISTLSTTVASIPANGVTVYAQLLSKVGTAWVSENYTYKEASSSSSPATLTSPAPGSTLGTTNVAFTWTAGTGVTSYQLLLGTTGAGSSNLYSSGTLTATSATVASIPATGVTVYAQLNSMIGGVWQSENYTYTESAPAVLSTPAPGSTLGTTNVAFTWTAGTGVTGYQLLLGTTGVGSSNLYSSGTLTTTTATVAGIPANGVTVNARLSSMIGGVWQSSDYAYTESPAGLPAAISTPASGSTLGTTNVVFTWTKGTAVTGYQLLLGTTGVGSSNLYSSGTLTTTTATVASIPATGVTVYAQLNSMIYGVWQSENYTYTETASSSGQAALTTPAPGSTLGTTNVTFTWTPGAGATAYRLFLGTTGVGSLNLYNSGTLGTTSTTVASIPANGVTVYAQLLSKVGSTWVSENYTYKEATGSSTPAALSSPASGSTLGTTNVVFTWTAGTGVTGYQLLLGTTGVGSSNLYSSGTVTTTTATVASIPPNGATVYAQLNSMIAGVWQSANYTFIESPAGVPAAISTPASGGTLGTTNVVFTWTKGTAVTGYQLLLGTTGVGSSNLYSSGTLTTTTATVASIPANGVTVYAQLNSMIYGVWQSENYTYTESASTAGLAAMTSPAPGSVLGTTNVVFTWTTGTGVTDYRLFLGTTGVGSLNLYNSGTLTTTTATVPSIPASGVTVYARLYSKIAGAWETADYTYTEQ
jgi:Bacterial Ig-like domain (group 3)/Astacin (Peptidase family M12A)